MTWLLARIASSAALHLFASWESFLLAFAAVCAASSSARIAASCASRSRSRASLATRSSLLFSSDRAPRATTPAATTSTSERAIQSGPAALLRRLASTAVPRQHEQEPFSRQHVAWCRARQPSQTTHSCVSRETFCRQNGQRDGLRSSWTSPFPCISSSCSRRAGSRVSSDSMAGPALSS
ncbi:hypothetical protein HY251_02695 [bacterium]|nr:hypothetical protein [bacterium]